MDITLNAINLKSKDYGENDKMCTLYSVELGKFSAVFKGVKKASAKLKFAAQPFCFGEYTLATGKGGYIVTGCVSNSQFFEISSDIDKFYTGCSILECVEHCSAENAKNPALFLLILKTLTSLNFSDDLSEKFLVYFIINAVKISGYKLTFDKCVNCKNKLSDKVFFSADSGGFTCGLCRNGLPVSMPIYNTLRLISITDYEKLSSLKLNREDLKESLKILNYFFNHCTGVSISVLSQYLKLE